MKPKIENNDLNLLFKINKKEILDNGFTKKVSQKLPLNNNFYLANYIIWTLATVLVIAVLFSFLNFTENFPHFITQILENFTVALTLFFKNSKIYITTFLMLLTAGGVFISKKIVF